MARARKAVFKVTYNNKDITRSMSPYLESVTYTDKVTGETDELEIVLDNTDEVWADSWYPEKGAKLQLWLGYDDTLVSCGKFEIDEILVSGPPDTVTIKALASWVTSTMRTKESKAWEGVTLKQLAEDFAKKHQLTLVGKIYTLRFERQTQNNENDLQYLSRLAAEYGHVFSIKGDKLVFESVYELEAGTPVLELDKTDLISYSITDKSADVYSEASVSYQDPDTGQTIDYTVTADQLPANNSQPNNWAKGVSPTFTQITNNYVANTQAGKKAEEYKPLLSSGWQEDKKPVNTLNVKTKAENKQQAEAKAKAALHKANSKQQSGTLSLQGNPLLVAGNNFDLTGLGRNSGRYNIETSTHRIDRGGSYTTDVDVKRVGFVEKIKNKPKTKKKKKKTQTYTYKTVN